MIFNLYSRVRLKLGDEEHVFDRARLMYSEVSEIEKVTGLSYAEWERELGRFSITAVGALLHVLRRRAEIPSDYATMQFNAADLSVTPLHEDGREFTADEVTADVLKRVEDAKAPPTSATAAAVAPENGQQATTITSLSLPAGTESAPGNGSTSNGVTSRSSRRTRTAS